MYPAYKALLEAVYPPGYTVDSLLRTPGAGYPDFTVSRGLRLVNWPVPQWQREARKFFGRELKPEQLACTGYAAGGNGLCQHGRAPADRRSRKFTDPPAIAGLVSPARASGSEGGHESA